MKEAISKFEHERQKIAIATQDLRLRQGLESSLGSSITRCLESIQKRRQIE